MKSKIHYSNKIINLYEKSSSKAILNKARMPNSENKTNILKINSDTKTNSKKIHIFKKYLNIINFILLEYLLILLPRQILAQDYYIELKVGKTGYQQIISDNYRNYPWIIYVNDEIQILRENRVNIKSIDDRIKLVWKDRFADFSYIFYNLTSITSIHLNNISIGYCDMSFMCFNCVSLVNFTQNTNTYEINNVAGMFYNCISLKSFSFSYFYSNNNVNINMSYMFYNCQSLYSLSYSSDLKRIIDIKGMFYNCLSLTSIDLQKFYWTENVDFSYTFYNCTNLKSISIPNPYYPKNMSHTFSNCISLGEMNINKFNKYNSHSLINMSNLFSNCSTLSRIYGDFSNIYISDAREMFSNCTSLNNINSNLNNLYIYNSQGNSINMSHMFYNCKAIRSISIYGYSYYRSYSNDLHKMFYNCNSLTSVQLRYFDVNNVRDMSYMFYNCKQLKNFNGYNNFYSSDCNLKERTMRGMFQNCEAITSLDISFLYTQHVEIMWDMFKNCKGLRYLYLNNFDTTEVTDMESMFEGCSTITSLYLQNFDTPKVQYMNKMFKDCYNLRIVNLKNIKSDSLGTMNQMFYNCRSLTSLNIYSLTEKDQSISEIFEGASNRIKFCVKEHENIPKIFDLLYSMSGSSRDCSSDCYNPNGRAIISEKKICCPYYKYGNTCIDKCPGRYESNGNKECIWFSCTYIYNYEQTMCINYLPAYHFINSSSLRTIDKCHDDCEKCSNKATKTSTSCTKCKNNKYEYLGNCYDQCLKGSYTQNGVKKCYCFEEKCKKCSQESLQNGLCETCNTNNGYYQKSDESKYNNFINCYKDPEKYYFDYNIYKPCYSSCKTCDRNGDYRNHYCKTCDDNSPFEYPKNGYVNCYPSCEHHYYFLNTYDYTCTDTEECPPQFGYIRDSLGECVKRCENDYKYELKKKCYEICPTDSIGYKNETDDKYYCKLSCPFERPFMLVKEFICVDSCTIKQRVDGLCKTNYEGNRTNTELQDVIVSDLEIDMVSDNFNYSMISEAGTIILQETDTLYEITTTDFKSDNSITSSLNLAECENSLRSHYQIEGELYILKYDVRVPGKTGVTVNYRIFSPLTGKNLMPLDLTMCEGKMVVISLPVNISGNPDLYDKNSPYYKDICVHYESDEGYDITLDDRQQLYIENNKSLCEEDCNFVGYNKITGKADCSCEVKFNLPLISEIKIDKDKLYKFMDIKKIANFDVLKCYKTLFSSDGIVSNIGFYIFLPSIVLYILSLIFAAVKEYKELNTKIKDIVWALKHLKYLKEPKKPKLIKEPKYEPIFIKLLKKRLGIELGLTTNKETNISDSKNTSKETIKEEMIDDDNNNEKVNSDYNQEKKVNSPPIKGLSNKKVVITDKLKKENNNINFENMDDDDPSSKKNLELRIGHMFKKVNDQKLSYQQIVERVKLIMKHNDSELNVLEFKDAIKHDKRNYFQYYFSLLKTKHTLIKIINKEDYNLRFIKIFLVSFSFSLVLSVNALFFSDDTMHKIYEDGGDFNFIYQLPQILYSSIISFIIETFLNFLALTEENVLSLKHEKVVSKVDRKAKDILKVIQVKIMSFYIFGFIFILIFWYYISCFCTVYRNTQYHLIKDSLFSFGTSFLTPLGLNLLPGLFRMPALKTKNGFFYMLSKILQMF